MELKEATYTVFDVETTGLYPNYGDRICEIGALRVSPDGKKEKFEVLIDPERALSREAFSINNITPEMLAGKPLIEEVLPEFMAFIKGSVLVAYNAGFDIGFIASSLKQDSLMLNDFYVVDALKLARKVFPDLSRYSLFRVAESLGISYSTQHRAMADVLVTWEVFRKEREILENRGIKELKKVAKKCNIERKWDDNSLLGLIRKAILEKEDLNITYKSLWNNQMTQRKVTPIQVQESIESSYLVAHCHLRGERRNFRLDCIMDAVNERQTK